MLRQLIPGARFGALVIICSLGLFSACKKDASDVERSTSKAQYQVRGEVKLLPTDTNEIEIHHEAMPDFIDSKGKKTGMVAMVMPFAVADGLSLTGIAVGDIVAFTLDLDWGRKPVLLITAIEGLPGDTALSL